MVSASEARERRETERIKEIMDIRNRFNRNLGAIQAAQKGSDLYGILEKAAFHIYLSRPKESALKNWLEANKAMAAYFTEPYMDLQENPEKGYLKRRLRNIAQDIRKEYEHWAKVFSREPTRTDEGHWEAAQNSMGECIANQFMIRYDGNVQKIFSAFHV